MKENNWVDLRSFRYCPACRAEEMEAFVLHGRRCRSCGFEFFVNVAAAVAVVIENDAGEVLFTVRAKDPGTGLLDLPGGFVDPGESTEEAAVREVREELGVGIIGLTYLGAGANSYPYKGVTYATADTFYGARLPEGAVPQPLDDIAELRWENPGTLELSLIAFTSIQRFFEQRRR